VAALVAMRRYEPLRRIGTFVAVSLALAGFGTLVGVFIAPRQPELAASVLRFYWFRLADVAVPLAMSLAIGRWLAESPLAPRTGESETAGAQPAPRLRWAALAVALAAGAWHVGDTLWQRWQIDLPLADGPRKVADYPAWCDACDWIARQTSIPPDARFLTPRAACTFKWRAERGEVATWKDIPQDAASIVEWWSRLRTVYGKDDPADPLDRWYDSLADRAPDDLLRVAQQYDAEYLLTEREPPLPLEVLYVNTTYAVYRMRAAR
jgi:hypothetical protein